uniref:TOC75-III (TRANSLOCON AT THE OUTER ENVELOPE MEMBRANE OF CHLOROPLASTS 75-III) n=1 Tax=Arundo donax TaxID=35708 RepID=A0A0A9HKA0_ARUDO
MSSSSSGRAMIPTKLTHLSRSGAPGQTLSA